LSKTQMCICMSGFRERQPWVPVVLGIAKLRVGECITCYEYGNWLYFITSDCLVNSCDC